MANTFTPQWQHIQIEGTGWYYSIDKWHGGSFAGVVDDFGNVIEASIPAAVFSLS